jgi:mono/diheme cytochrome c family protein
MRGTIDVRGPANETAQAQQPPLYETLDLDIDAQPRAKNLPGRRPSAARGARLAGRLPEVYTTQDYYRAHTPEEAWQDLRAEASLKPLGEDDLWDLVAWTWGQNTTPQGLADGRGLYAVNCAACHGESGKGDGVFARATSRPAGEADMNTQHAGNGIKPPVDFTDAAHMLAASPARLQGKIIRGGMGTGMPYWGPIFTDEQIWNLVAFLSTIQFDYNMEVK